LGCKTEKEAEDFAGSKPIEGFFYKLEASDFFTVTALPVFSLILKS